MPVRSPWILAWMGSLILNVCWAGLALGAPPTLTVDPADVPLVIRGTLDGKTTTFSGNVRLTTAEKSGGELRLLSSDLELKGNPARRIDRSNVTIAAGTSLSKDQPRDVRVTVNNVTRPGTWTGKLKWSLAGQGEALALEIPLELRLDAKPDVRPVVANQTIQVVNCDNAVSRGVANWFLPRSMTQDTRIIHLDNHTLTSVKLEKADAVLRGDKTGATVLAGQVALETPVELQPGEVAALPLIVQRSQLSPDRYQGTLRLTFEGSDEPVVVNLDLSVRDGPLWAIAVIVFGILVGRLARDMDTPEARLQLKLYTRWQQLGESARNVADEGARAAVERSLRSLERRIDAGRETEEVLTQALKAQEEAVEFLINLDDLQQELGKQPEALRTRLQPLVNQARAAILAGNGEVARSKRGEVEQGLRDGGPRQIAASKASKQPKDGISKRFAWLAEIPALLSGTVVRKANLRYKVIQPLLSFVLLVVLALLGLQTLYVNAGVTFGANGLYDYLGLFLWGISADVAQRTLQNLPAAR